MKLQTLASCQVVVVCLCTLNGCASKDGMARIGLPAFLSRAEPGPKDEFNYAADESKMINSQAISQADASRQQTASLASATKSSGQRPALLTLTKNDDFTQLVNTTEGVVLIDFYADWCGPCKQQGKVLHELEATAAQNNAQIVKVNIDEYKALAKQFQVGPIPTLVAMKNGRVISKTVGLTEKDKLAAMLAQ